MLNARLGHRGQVFVDRYHAEIIDSPRQARHALAYVLNNWRRHGEHRQRAWQLDPYSSAISFRGWAEQPFHWDAPATYERLPVCMPQTWLLYAGWARYGPIEIAEVPRAR